MLRELSAAASDTHQRNASEQSGNGCEEDTDTSAILEEAQYATISGAVLDLVDSEKPRLLLVDDDQLLLRATRRVLKCHYHVLTSSNPTEALMIIDKLVRQVSDCLAYLFRLRLQTFTEASKSARVQSARP